MKPVPFPPSSQVEPEGPTATTREEVLHIAGEALHCVHSVMKLQHDTIAIHSESWTSKQVPGGIVRSLLQAKGGEIDEKTETEILGFEGQVIGGEHEHHPWACFAPGAWVELRITTQNLADPETPISTTRNKQTLIEVTEAHAEVEFHITVENLDLGLEDVEGIEALEEEIVVEPTIERIQLSLAPVTEDQLDDLLPPDPPPAPGE